MVLLGIFINVVPYIMFGTTLRSCGGGDEIMTQIINKLLLRYLSVNKTDSILIQIEQNRNEFIEPNMIQNI